MFTDLLIIQELLQLSAHLAVPLLQISVWSGLTDLGWVVIRFPQWLKDPKLKIGTLFWHPLLSYRGAVVQEWALFDFIW